MALVTFNKNLFEKEIGKLNEDMQNKIAMFGTPIDSLNNEEVQIEVFPNRPDLLSYHGFKRSFLSFLEKETGLKKYKVNPPEKDYELIVDNSVKDIRPFTACAIVKDLKFDDLKIKEIIDLQEKIHLTLGRKRKKLAIGVYPLDKIKLPITFKALEPDKIKFVPLESDKEMSGLEILQKHPTGKEYSSLLTGKPRFPIFVDSDNNILSMPPIINSQKTGKIDVQTKDVFVECSGYDLESLKKCLNIVVTCLADMGGKIYQMNVKYKEKEKTPNLSPQQMKVSLDNINRLLGVNLNEKQIKTLFEKMGCDYNKKIVEIPAWRTDVLHEVDLIEDIAIAYGYDKFEYEIPKISTVGEEDAREVLKRNIGEILSGVNLLEVSNYHLTNKKDQFLNMGAIEKKEKDFVELKESKTEYNILRKNLSHYLLKIFSENVDSEYPQRIFEIGKIFELDTGVIEKERVAVGISPGNFTELKQILDYLSRMIKVNFELKEPQVALSYFVDGRVAEIFINNKSSGFVGEIHPKILKNWKIRMPVALFEIELDEIFEKLI